MTDRQTDRQTENHGENNVSSPDGGDIITIMIIIIIKDIVLNFANKLMAKFSVIIVIIILSYQ